MLRNNLKPKVQSQCEASIIENKLSLSQCFCSSTFYESDFPFWPLRGFFLLSLSLSLSLFLYYSLLYLVLFSISCSCFLYYVPLWWWGVGHLIPIKTFSLLQLFPQISNNTSRIIHSFYLLNFHIQTIGFCGFPWILCSMTSFFRKGILPLFYFFLFMTKC